MTSWDVDRRMRPKASPALSLNRRLRSCVEKPSWAIFLPIEIQLGLGEQGKNRATSLDQSAEQDKSRKAATKQALPMQMNGVLPHKCCEELPTRSSLVPLRGRVWKLARHPNGCREVQHAIDAADSDETRVALVKELQHHVWEAMRCPHANYVLQKAIAIVRPDSLQFIVDEIVQEGTSAIVEAAKHKYGCRIIQRFLENCRSDQLEKFVETLSSHAESTSKHPYGNYVMQRALEHCTNEQKYALIAEIQRSVDNLATDEYGCAVVGKAILRSECTQQLALASALVNVPGTISSMAGTRHGDVVACLVLQTLSGAEHRMAVEEIRTHAAQLCHSRYGRIVLALVAKLSDSE